MIPSKQLEMRKAALTRAEIETVEEGASVYGMSGRAFLKTNKADLLKKLSSIQDNANEQIIRLQAQQATFESQLKK